MTGFSLSRPAAAAIAIVCPAILLAAVNVIAQLCPRSARPRLAAPMPTTVQQALPFFTPARERCLEYALTKRVHSLAFPKKTVVGVAPTLPLDGALMAPMPGRPLPPNPIVEQLRQLYEVRTL